MLKEKIKEILKPLTPRRIELPDLSKTQDDYMENIVNQILQAVEEDRKKKVTEEVKIDFNQKRLKKESK